MGDSSADLECGGGCFSDEDAEEEEEEEASCFYSTCGGDDPEEEEEADCRICHLSLDGDEDAIQLGCCCKNDLAAAHKHCADTWFKIKGNKTCEICNSIASNLVEMPMPMSASLTHVAVLDLNLEATTTTTTTTHGSSTTTRGGGGGGQGQGCINGHRLLNFILACLVFAFVISWLFHFNIPS